ncbi:nitrogenase component 1 [Sporomusa sp.]|uniref:nitrogenase component 1 n=1 Tax=Sporomusa sp. TaxID=2078658 RepID=UPI002B858BA0|nr:nitrogenase component 1 [Sporomusa sp.]HWR44945.1 nitrogenase component 1 [Sporomusa sp.]
MSSNFIEKPRYQCALGGALVTINAINRAVAIVHSAPGCASAADGAAKSGSGYWGTSYCNGRATPSTNILEKEVIFGGESRLAEQIDSTLEIIDADLYAVITGCMTDIIGDDVQSITGRFRAEGKPVVVAETGGFKGNSASGYDLILAALIAQVVEKGLAKVANQINLLGVIPTQDVFWRGNLLELKRILEDLGLQVNTFFSPFDKLSSLKTSSQAALNVVLSDVHGLGAAQAFEEIHGIPFVNIPLPIGPTATQAFLAELARHIAIEPSVLAAVIQRETEWYYAYVEHVAELYNDLDLQRFAIVVGDANYSYALTRFIVDDFGWIPYLVAVTDILDDTGKAKVAERFNSLPAELRPKLIFETDTSRIATSLQEELAKEPDEYGSPISPAFVLGSTWDRPLAHEFKAGFLSVTYPVSNRVVTDQAYAGYRGGLRLVTDILSTLISNR